MATKKVAKKPAKKAVKKAPDRKSAVKKADAVSSVRGRKAKDDLYEAISRNNIQKLRTLISQGADINVRDEEGWTPLHLAAEIGYPNGCQLLIEAGADIHAKSKAGQTPLHEAAMSSVLECCQLLIEAGADIHALDKDDWTPLHWAVDTSCEEWDICQYLIEAGADVNALNKDGKKPIDLTYEDELVSLLRAAEKKAPAKKVLTKKASKGLTTWNVQASGTALVRGHFTIQAATQEEAWEKAYNRINDSGLNKDELEFFEIRLNEQPDEVWQKK